MVWTGPVVNSNRPELRKYSLWLNGSDENLYMREIGIRCLMDHEIGTHFYRSYNDGLQPWFSERVRFGLRKMGSFEGQCSEEGLAAIHTVLRGRISYLWGAALTYYIACKSAEMTFKELFDHLGRFTSNPDYRWKQAMRVKRGLADPNDLGGFGNDQCYFEGAVNILRRIDDIDFQLLMMGKVCYDELDRIKRVARKDVVQYPNFMKNISAYRKSLRKMMILNGLDGVYPHCSPPAVYLKYLEKKRGKNSKKSKKVRSHTKLNVGSKVTADAKKGKNKRTVVDGGVKSFRCSYPFINMHLREKPLTEVEKALQTHSDGLKNVADLTKNLLLKNTRLEAQIQKLHNIVKKHKWTSGNDLNKEGLEKEISESQKEFETPVVDNHPSDGATLPDINKDYNSFSLGWRNSNTDPDVMIIGDIEETMESLCGSSDNDSDSSTTETEIHSLCASSPSHMFLSEEIDNETEQGCFDVEHEMNNISISANVLNENQQETLASFRNEIHLKQKEKTANICLHQSRQVLYTPVADLSVYDNAVANVEHSRRSIIEPPNVGKRISLSCATTSETIQNKERKKRTLLTLRNPKYLPRDKIYSIHTPDLLVKTEKDYPQYMQSSSYNVTAVSDLSSSSNEIQLPESSRSSQNKPRFISPLKRPVTSVPARPEKVVKVHWVNLNSSNSKVKTVNAKPARYFNTFSNNCRSFKHNISSSTEGSL